MKNNINWVIVLVSICIVTSSFLSPSTMNIDILWLRYNDSLIYSYQTPHKKLIEIKETSIEASDTITYLYASDSPVTQKHLTKLFLTTKTDTVLLSSEENEYYPDGGGRFSASRLVTISDSLKQTLFNFDVLYDSTFHEMYKVVSIKLIK